jgi:hypothetical protein
MRTVLRTILGPKKGKREQEVLGNCMMRAIIPCVYYDLFI